MRTQLKSAHSWFEIICMFENLSIYLKACQSLIHSCTHGTGANNLLVSVK